MHGYVTDIQRFSLNDGDGIRTTVFLNGCNMRCEWCHNPETIDFENNILLYENNCIGCGKCFSVCPNGAHGVKDGKHVIDKEKCKRCGKCVDMCYAEAIRFSARKMSTEEVVDEIVQDIPYYENSGGGVTLSGGEALCQAEFAESIVDACRMRKISTAVETNLCHDFDKIKGILKKVDLIMFDIKMMDSDQHRKYTKVGNELILENAKKADELGVPMIVRTPLIPGVTDSDENLIETAEFVSGLKNAVYYELLNFNPLGGSKYKALFEENCFEGVRPLKKARLDEIKEKLDFCNVKIS